MAWFGLGRAAWPRMGVILPLALAIALPGLAHAQDAEQADQAQTEAAQAALAQPATSALAVPMFGGDPAAESLAASRFDAPTLNDRGRALDCMSMAIAYEAAGQPAEGQQAVGQVILNRMRDPRFPKTVCGVVFQGSERITGCQFTFTCDGSFRRRLSDNTLVVARGIAESVLNGAAPDRVAGATHYHANYVLPYWASSGRAVAKIGAHIFYRMRGDAMRTVAAANLTRPEPMMPALRRLAAGRRRWPALAQAAPAAPQHALFAPWGLPVTTVSQR